MDSCPEGTSVLERIFEGVSVYYNYTGKVECFQLDDDPHGMDGWNWQVYIDYDTFSFLYFFFFLWKSINYFFKMFAPNFPQITISN